MIYIPLTIAIIMIGIVVLQEKHLAFSKKKLDYEKTQLLAVVYDMKKLQDRFEDYKKKVDALALRAGFKS